MFHSLKMNRRKGAEGGSQMMIYSNQQSTYATSGLSSTSLQRFSWEPLHHRAFVQRVVSGRPRKSRRKGSRKTRSGQGRPLEHHPLDLCPPGSDAPLFGPTQPTAHTAVHVSWRLKSGQRLDEGKAPRRSTEASQWSNHGHPAAISTRCVGTSVEWPPNVRVT